MATRLISPARRATGRARSAAMFELLDGAAVAPLGPIRGLGCWMGRTGRRCAARSSRVSVQHHLAEYAATLDAGWLLLAQRIE